MIVFEPGKNFTAKTKIYIEGLFNSKAIANRDLNQHSFYYFTRCFDLMI